MKTFTEYLRGTGRDAELLERIERAGSPAIRDRDALLKFCKERWPDEYSRDWRKVTGGARSREAMEKLWADYLVWKESDAAAAQQAAAPLQSIKAQAK